MKDKQASAKHQASRCAVRPPYVARIPGCSLIALGRPERLGGSWVLPLVWFHILLLDGWADGWTDGFTDMSRPVNQSVSQSVSQSNLLVWFHIYLLDGWADGWVDGWTDMSQPVNESVSHSANRSNKSPSRMQILAPPHARPWQTDCP